MSVAQLHFGMTVKLREVTTLLCDLGARTLRSFTIFICLKHRNTACVVRNENRMNKKHVNEQITNPFVVPSF